ncbi:hypothetical protein [Streptomyces clavuligerus]|nr:hypothetical protein [Streptomyces clavuligerus]EDY47730.1 hypothetical protein SSCG_00758 [Streptomyces clavuligerus]
MPWPSRVHRPLGTASVDGDWRWNFGGTSTTGATLSGADFVDVR